MTKKSDRPYLSIKQLEHLISVSIRNNLDVIGGVTGDGYQFTILLDCLAPQDCIPHDQEPEDEEEGAAILECHGVYELYNFLSSIMGIRREGIAVRAVDTVVITNDNLAEFLYILDGMCNYWDDILEEEQPNIEGKNVVAGNGTVN